MTGTSIYVVGVTVGELLAKMINELSVFQKKPALKELKDSFRVLEDHNIIYRIGESYENMECQIKVLPSMLLAVPNDRCKAICEILQNENMEAGNEKSDEDTADKLALLHE